MQLKKIKLHNFRNFKDSEIAFSTETGKNFTIILGQNTFGKTTLVKAFLWALYKDNQFANKILLNSDIASKMDVNKSEEVYVEIDLSHKQYDYKIITSQFYRKNLSGGITADKIVTRIIRTDDNAYTIPESKCREEINNILREELKDYFFFDGENNSIESVSKKTNLTTAVSNILNLSKIQQLCDYYNPNRSGSVVRKLNNELELNFDAELDELQTRRDDYYDKLDRYEKELKNAQYQISKLNDDITEREHYLDQNRDVIQFQNEKRRLEISIKQDKNSKEETYNSIISSINSGDMYLKTLFAKSFNKFNMESLKDTSSFSSNESYKGITESGVQELINRGRCICGCEIKNGNDAYNHLIAAKEHMEPHDYGKYLSDFISYESANISHSQNVLNTISTNSQNVINYIQAIENNEVSLKETIGKLENREDVGKLQKDINDLREQLGQQKQIQKNLENIEIPNIKLHIEELEKKINRAAVKSGKNDFTRLCIDYAEEVYDIANKRMERSKKEIQQNLQQEVGSIFKNMYHGNRGIRIDENFKVSTYVLTDGNDSKLDGSTGLSTVMNYSFVAGLLKLAKKSLVDSDDPMADIDETGESYPLVMDAPFSNTDEEHIKNICTVLPNYCDQIIMFVMKKDFQHASESISDKIGKKYVIKQINETESVIEEEI